MIAGGFGAFNWDLPCNLTASRMIRLSWAASPRIPGEWRTGFRSRLRSRGERVNAPGVLERVPGVRCVASQLEMVYHEEKGYPPMAEATLEQRMTVLEETVRELQDAMNARLPAADWLDRVIGSMKDEPAFDEVLAHGRAIRAAGAEG
jgi:hypothetical protein